MEVFYLQCRTTEVGERLFNSGRDAPINYHETIKMIWDDFRSFCCVSGFRVGPEFSPRVLPPAHHVFQNVSEKFLAFGGFMDHDKINLLNDISSPWPSSPKIKEYVEVAIVVIPNGDLLTLLRSDMEPIMGAERVAHEALQIAEQTKVELERIKVQLEASNLRNTSLEENTVRMTLESTREIAALHKELDGQRETIRTLMDRVEHQ